MTSFLRTFFGRAVALPALALASSGLLASVSARADETFTAAQRQEIVSIVRQALKTDPSILADAITTLRAQSEATKQADALKVVRENHAKLAGSSTDVVLGNPHGTQTIVEFYDPRCPYCRKVLPDLDRLVAEEPGLKLIEKVIPVLGAGSQLEAQALLAAALQGGYMKLQHALMNDSETPSVARIRTLAGSAGLDADRLERDMKSADVASAMRENLALAQKIGVDGTPTFVIDEKMIIPGAAGLDDLKNALKAAATGR
ncbi:DsbA family protein [Acetobacter fallax]|uniref:Thioredoxin domain-containing protein n=1 Tax=Acetobacter fallax TaxID=1737473 RepID=A0ABX0K868_9PROT|nr:DsbA family protein [Acetobacter fallax]NHO32120.1 thioredoxin domain-containing protein [Acetobacter fallax]NHO35609.1 thioredoxin domain-containing protein [Acetobacter fallax]